MSAYALGMLQSTYFCPNFRKWSEFGLFSKYQSEFGLNLLKKSDFFNFKAYCFPETLKKKLMFVYSIFLAALLNPVTFWVNTFTFYIKQGLFYLTQRTI